MKWNSKDLQQYISAKEYVDTIIMPLIPFSMSRDADLEKGAFQSEVLSIFAKEIEKELTGRIMLIPDYYYLKSADKEAETERINQWNADVQSQPFTNTFFLTFDASWKKNEQELNGHLLWLPAIQSGNLHSTEMHTIIRDQVKQISELIRAYW
jgi:hypothetical protein